MDAATSQTEPDPRRWWALALLCGAFFMVILDAAIVTVALPSIEDELGFSAQGLQWVVSAYALTFAGLLLLGVRVDSATRGSRGDRATAQRATPARARATDIAWTETVRGSRRRARRHHRRCGPGGVSVSSALPSR